MFGIFLAALGGALTAPMISVAPGLSVSVVIVLAVVIIGGLGSIEGAAIGALIVGPRAGGAYLAAGRALQHLPRDGDRAGLPAGRIVLRMKARRI
jgi:branched-chain amino acid transport system permease protein